MLEFKYTLPSEEQSNEDGSVTMIQDNRVYDQDTASVEKLTSTVKRLMSQGYDLKVTITGKVPKGE